MTPENGNFWYFLIYNFVNGFLVVAMGMQLPDHQYMGLPVIVTQYASVLFVVTFTYLAQFINFRVAGILIPAIFSLEFLRRNAKLIFTIIRFLLLKG